MISSLDFVGIPSQDAERSRTFYVETLGLRPDDHARFEVWVGETCLSIWEPEKLGIEFAPQKNAHPALHVDDVAATRAELEGKGVAFSGDTFDTGVCPRRSSPIPMATT
ncbi:MAG: VOC family protein [Actinomycetota bacterium]